MGIPALLQSEFSLTPAGTKNPGQVTSPSRLIEQQCDRAARRLNELGKIFRKQELAENVWMRFATGDRTLDEDVFRLEVTALSEEKLILARQKILVPTAGADEGKVQSFYEFRHQRILEYFLACYLCTWNDSDIVTGAQNEELKGVIIVLADLLSLERATELERAITMQELETHHLVVAAELRLRLGARWLRDHGSDPYGAQHVPPETTT